VEYAKVKNKMRFSRKIKNLIASCIQKTLYYLIGVPVLKIISIVTPYKEKYYANNKEKYQKATMKEIIRYIDRQMSYYGSGNYIIYNARMTDDNNYGNSFHLHEFMNGWRRKKFNKKSYIFYTTFMKKRQESEFYYHLFFESIENHFKKYDDLQVTRGVEAAWKGGETYIKINSRMDQEEKVNEHQSV
jgi:hypothetical protein